MQIQIGMQVYYRKITGNEQQNNWTLVSNRQFEYTEYGTYQVKVVDIDGNEKISSRISGLFIKLPLPVRKHFFRNPV